MKFGLGGYLTDFENILGAVRLSQISDPKAFFDSEPRELEKIVDLVRRSFDSKISYEDIYQHVTIPDDVYLLEDGDKILAMASYSHMHFGSLPVLVAEGAAVAPEVQKRGIFGKITKFAFRYEHFILGRTQNPHVYRAFQDFCFDVYPNSRGTPKTIIDIREDYALNHLSCKIDKLGVVRGVYGRSLYFHMPLHEKVTKLFEQELHMIPDNGDAVILVGMR